MLCATRMAGVLRLWVAHLQYARTSKRAGTVISQMLRQFGSSPADKGAAFASSGCQPRLAEWHTMDSTVGIQSFNQI